jgi:hypothetical protein
MDRMPLVGRTFFAVGLVAFGILHVVYGDFVTRVVPGWPGVDTRTIGLGLPDRRDADRRRRRDAPWDQGATRANETTAVFEALAFPGPAFLLAGTVARTKRH